MRSGKLCSRRNKSPNATTTTRRNTAVTTIRMSVLPGGVMKIGKWWVAAGLTSADIPGPPNCERKGFALDQRVLADLRIAGFRSIRAENEFKARMEAQQIDVDQGTTYGDALAGSSGEFDASFGWRMRDHAARGRRSHSSKSIRPRRA